jgi:heme O synthase-like polyprenyltransferase
MLPVKDPDGRVTAQVVVLTTLMLLPIMLIAALAGLIGWVATIGSALLGAWMLWLAVRFHADRDRQSARQVFLASIVYLSIVMVLVVADQGSISGEMPTVHGVTLASGERIPR